MEQPGVHSRDPIVTMSSASGPDDLMDRPVALILSPSTAPLPPNVSSSNNSSSANSRLLLLRLELALAAVQAVASVVVLTLSRHERPQTPFRPLIIGYAFGCVAALPLLCWDYCNLDHTLQQVPASEINICFGRIIQFETVLSFFMEHDAERAVQETRSRPYSDNLMIMRLLVACSKIMLNVLFGYWLMLAGLKINSPTSSSSEAPILYWLTVGFFVFCCFEHVSALIVCPVLRISGVLNKQGARSEWINALPTHRFELKKDRLGNDGVAASSPEKGGGVLGSGTDEERVISGEDAVCSICLGIYAENDELRELPCSHLLHKDCVDKWLKIKASCPLCKAVIRPGVPS